MTTKHLTRLTVLTVGAALAAMSVAAPAQAEDDCTITAVTPSSVTLASEADGYVLPLHMDTSCPEDEDILRWYMNLIGPEGSTGYGYGYIMATNFERAGSGKAPWVYYENGLVPFTPTNEQAGVTTLYAWGFYGEDDSPDEGDEYMTSTTELSLLRATRFNRANASPEPVRKNRRLTIRSAFVRANWDTKEDEPFDGPVTLQFRGKGESSYSDVKTFKAVDGDIETTARARRSGYWRFHFEGDDTSAASNSRSDYVRVGRAKRKAVYYANCAAVRAAGAAPLYVGQPGYSRDLDRDGDGVACE